MSTNDISKFTPNSEITIYETEDGKVKIDVHFKNENIWLSQKLMAELFECSSDNISLHLKNIYSEGELDETAATEEFSVVRQEGKRQVKRNLIFCGTRAKSFAKLPINWLKKSMKIFGLSKTKIISLISIGL